MDAIEEVKARLSIEDVISEYVQLKRSGRNWRGLSPFTNEKTPSFMVSPEKQIWHDFSSGKGGNMFNFVMEMEGLDFKGALELLARQAGIDLEQYRTHGADNGPDKKRLQEVLELSTKFYQRHFTRYQVAFNYILHERKFTRETVLTWRIGYAPASGSALTNFLSSKGFTEMEMNQAGVSVRRSQGYVDMFRDRLIIPLQDSFGAVIGFTARILSDSPNAPKYINTPHTVLYDKSRHVFGLHLAKEAIRKDGYAVVTEGNLDVIASHQAGVAQVVAVAGTALTEQQVKILSRLTNDIRLCFDADRAGLAATERSIPIASKVGVSLGIIDIPSGKDPDELIRKDPKLWQAAVNSQTYALDWLMEHYKQLIDINSAPGKRQFTDILLPLVRRLSDSVEQDHYMNAIASAIDVSRDALASKLHGIPENKVAYKSQRNVPVLSSAEQIEYDKLQDHLLALAYMEPNLRGHLSMVTPDMLFKSEAKQLLALLRDNPQIKDESHPQLKPVVEYVKILELEYEELYQNVERTELEYEVTRLQTRLVEAYVKQQKQKLATSLEVADEVLTTSLLEQVKQLDLLLKNVTGGI
ncbi:MAG TPA: DNA primase [Candidatus Saccharimonadales bacterium]|nr:DNA primase [Candidatus Saccharimonadales bacterium]